MAPKNATVRGDGFRMYQWPGGDTELNRRYNAVEPSDLLSVTSIRTLCGEPFQLVNWKIDNVVRVAMGTRKVPAIGKRGGILKGKFTVSKDGPFPGEFVTRMIETRGAQEGLELVRSWLKAMADEPRDIAAVRGTVVHKLIELNAPMTLVDADLATKRFELQWLEEKRRVKPDVTEDDVNFIVNAMRQYWDMRAHVPFVIVAQEPQVYNLTVGYGGSADVLMWFLPEGSTGEDIAKWQALADKGKLTLPMIQSVGGFLAVGDWKTSAGVYTSHIVQTTAYMAAEFVAEDGVIDTRLSDILEATSQGLVIQIRPDHWTVDTFDFRQDVLRAFLGSVAFARFLALHKLPEGLFTSTITGQAEGTEKNEEEVGDGE